MKTSVRHLFLSLAVAFGLSLALVTVAQEPASSPTAAPAPDQDKASPVAAPARPDTPPAPAAVAAPAEPAKPNAAPAEAPKPEATPAAEATVVTPAEAPKSPETKPAEEPKLRRLDQPSPADEQKRTRKAGRTHFHHDSGNEIVNVGSDSFLAKGLKADAVVSVFGNATSEGDVADSVVSVLGNTRATGPVGNAAVAVLGNTYVNGKVGDAVVAVLGNVDLGPEAEVAGDVVAVGGSVHRDPKAVIHGKINNVSFGGVLSDLDWLHSWFVNCALYGRLLAFGPHLMWAWWIALGFLAFYVVLALLFGRGIEKCAETLEERPGYSILAALLTVLLAPIACILLILTGIGIAVVPFLAAGLFFAGLFGKAVMLAWLGRRVTGLFGIRSAALAVLIGGVIVLGLYTVPILSIVIYKLFGWIGLGVVVYTLLLNMKREKPAPPPVVPAPTGVPPTDASGSPAVLAPVLAGPAAGMPPPVATPSATLPRAGFAIRLAALLIDVILVAIVLGLFHLPAKVALLLLAGYGAGMWKLRGTTIGGIVCGLKVVRLDDRELDWSTAIVRALGCFLSLIVVGLGFIWVAFDDQKQSWHDKIAGTTVVRVPKGVSLV